MVMNDFHRIKRLPPYVFEQVNRIKAASRNNGADIIDLGMGNPDLPAPRHVIEKMVEGRIRKFFEEVVLLKQAFVMNPDQTIEQLVAETAKTLGSPVTVKGFSRLALGEGVEKKTEDFAAEVAGMAGQS